MKLLFIAFLAIIVTAESLRCEPNSVFKNRCNTCRCSPNGEHALCTLKACIHISDSSNTHETRKSRSIEVPKTVESEKVCQPGTTFKDYCNTCKCGSDGIDAVCTLMDCDENLWNKDGTRKSDETTVFPIEQYDYIDEAMQLPDFLCTETKTFQHYCNRCSCVAVGRHPFCTMVGCSAKYWNKDGTLKHDLSEEFTTQPLEQI